MGCDWYNISSLSVCGIIFISKTLSEELIKKYNLIKINTPLNVDINFIKIEYNEEKSIIEITEDESDKILSNRYNKVPALKEAIEESYYDNDRRFIVDLSVEDSNETNNADHIYIYPCGPKKEMKLSVPGPYEIYTHYLKLSFTNLEEIKDEHKQILEELKASCSLTNDPLFNFEKYLENENYEEFHEDLELIQTIPITKSQPSWIIQPKISDITILTTSNQLVN